MPYCQSCGRQINDNEKLCAGCGEYERAVALQRNSQPVVYVPANNNLKWIAIIAAAAVALVVTVSWNRPTIDKGVEAATAKQETHSTETEAPKKIEKSEDARLIEDVLAQDKTYSDVMLERVRRLPHQDIAGADDMAQYIDDYVKAAENIDTRKCPRDFADAYYRSIVAKSEVAEMSRAHPQIPTGDDAAMRKLWKYMQGDPTGGDDELKGEVLSWVLQLIGKMKQAQERWQDVQNIAVRYGAA